MAPGGTARMPHSEARTGRILIVDDQPANLRVVGALLERNGYAVATAGNGPDALAAARAAPPDLVLLDMMMPGMDGFELLAALKGEPGMRQVPAIFLTAAQDRELLLRAFEAGAVDYVTKPFIPEELLARVGAHIGLKLTRDRLERVARERQELVNLVAHDLKNPLNVILGRSEILEEMFSRNTEGAQAAQPQLRHIRASALRLTAMIDELITDAMNDALDISVRNEVVDLAAIVRDVAEANRPLAERKSQKIELAASGELSTRCDPERIREAIDNLVSNAVKYSKIGGAIRVEAAVDGLSVPLEVDVTPDKAPRVGDRVAIRPTRVRLFPAG